MMQPAVLYVEDDLLSRKVMEMMLVGRMQLKDVTIFEDSRDIIQRVSALDRRPDIILLDIHMQPHDGFDVLKMLHERPEFDSTQIVALTASVMNEEVKRLETAGFDGCLSKPIDVDNFPQLFSRILAGETIWHIGV